jgi:hypothetical protein
VKRLADSEPRPARTAGKVGTWAVIVIGMLAVAVIALALAGCGDGKSKTSSAPAIRGVFAEINRVRRQAHLKPLTTDAAASNVAWHHSLSMAETTGLAAVPKKDLKRFFLNGRKRDVYQVNLYFSGVGGRSLPSTGELVDYMMRAHGGRARARGILDPNHNRVGIAITRQPSSLWATAIFITASKYSASLSRGRASANQARLEKGGPVKLLPGGVSTDALGTPASFEVFNHWYGEQELGLLRLSKRLTTGGYQVDDFRGGIEIETLDSPLARSVRRLESAAGIRVHHVSAVRIGGHFGRRYSLSSSHPFELRPGNNIGTGERDVILLGVGQRTLVIKKGGAAPIDAPDDQTLRQAERVIQSFRFHS